MSDGYRRIAPYYDRVIEPLTAGLRRMGKRMYPPPAGAAVLDVGCGTGTHLALYLDTDADLFGVDASPAMLQRARERLGDRADLRLSDASQLPFDDQTFDLTITSAFLHELDAGAAQAVLAEVQRTLRPGGRWLAIDYRSGPLDLKGRMIRAATHGIERLAGRTHYRNFRSYLQRGGLEALAADAGFRVAEENIVSGGGLSVALLDQE